ncbi:MAG: ADP-ribosylglycohydrolase family protein [Parachlamydiaceae bacterium]|nr:ADP-ribosylglycohydrolase family protein [Parachlamydiaceae bacterium]
MHQISLSDRLRGAVLGQFIGGAVSDKTRSFTQYNDAALLLLHSLKDQHGFSARDFGRRFVEKFASPAYIHSKNKTASETIENYFLSLEEGHPDLGYEFQGGANTADIDTATRLAPVVAIYWDDPKLLAIVDKVTRVTQNNELAVAYMRSYTRILCALFQGEQLPLIFINESKSVTNDTPIDLHVRKKVKEAIDLEAKSIGEASKQLGNGSYLDQSYPLAIHSALKNAQSFENGILDSTSAGGDSIGRAALIGSWLGAHLGIPNIPHGDLINHTEIEKDTEVLLNIQTFRSSERIL